MPGRLTLQEYQCVRGVERGLRNKEIARDLSISPASVARHLATAYKKLGVTNRMDAVQMLRRNYEDGAVPIRRPEPDVQVVPVEVPADPPTRYRPPPPGAAATNVLIAAFAVIGVLVVCIIGLTRAMQWW
jgi:DNA-binding CsgD family transcriptional regulator